MTPLRSRIKFVLFFSILLALTLAIQATTAARTATAGPGQRPAGQVAPAEAEEDVAGGQPIWDETVHEILGDPGEQVADERLGMPEGHLGWDKATNRPLPDPTIVEAPARSVGEAAPEKVAALKTDELVFRSGYRQAAANGLDAAWLDQMRSRAPGAGPAYSVIQFSLPFDTAARVTLEEKGVKFYNYVDGGGLYARLPAGALPTLEQLAGAGRVLHAGPIPWQARVEPALLAQGREAPESAVPVVVQLFDLPDQAQLGQFAGLLEIQDTSLHPALPLLSGIMPAGKAEAIARLPFVRWVEREIPNTLGNLESTMGLGTDILRDQDSSSDGTNITVAVMDTGIANPYHADLPSSRVLDQHEYYPNDDATAEDNNSHGTHVAGTIGGDNSGWMQGHAPDVDFLIYKLCCDSGGTGFPTTDFQDAIEEGASEGMLISNNSWGGGNGVYRTNAEIADRAVRGEYSNQPTNMVIITHNDNALSRSPGTAKNAITVGAVYDGNWPNQAAACGTETNWPPGQRACFSNYGPIDIDGDGNKRVKPDVMAPGVRIRSTIPGNSYGYKNGTSMAAPGVSGALAAVLDHYADSTAWLLEWPETVKAMALAHAIDVGGNTDLYGRGMLSAWDMSYFWNGVTGGHSFWGNTIVDSNDDDLFTFSVGSGYDYVVAVLTWPDPAGSTELANDLDLYVYSNSSCSGSAVGYSIRFDDPVEYVRVPSGSPSGTWCAKVSGFSVSSSQTFGLATNVVLLDSAPYITTSDSATTVQPNACFYHYTTIYNGGFTSAGNYVRLRVPDGLTVEGARMYTDDGRNHYYDDPDLYTTTYSGGIYWRIAVGHAQPATGRLVRWYICVDNNAAPGPYTLQSQAFYRKAGITTAGTGTDYDAITVPAAVAPHLDIALASGTAIDLTWTTHTNNCQYVVHSADTPYFWPARYTEVTSTSGGSYTVLGATGHPSQNNYYVVRAANCGTDTADSNRTGEFDFALVSP